MKRLILALALCSGLLAVKAKAITPVPPPVVYSTSTLTVGISSICPAGYYLNHVIVSSGVITGGVCTVAVTNNAPCADGYILISTGGALGCVDMQVLFGNPTKLYAPASEAWFRRVILPDG